MLKSNLEKELRKWREARARKHGGRSAPLEGPKAQIDLPGKPT